MNHGLRPHRYAAASVVAVAALVLTACGSNGPEVTSTSGPATPAATSPGTATGATARAPSPSTAGKNRLTLTLSGGLTGKVTAPDKPPRCRYYVNDILGGYVYGADFDITVDGTKYTLGILHSRAKKKGPETVKAADLNLGLDAADDSGGWSSFLPKDPKTVKGTVTIAADRSGTLDATFGRRKDDGKAPVTIKGSWSCARFAKSAA